MASAGEAPRGELGGARPSALSQTLLPYEDAIERILAVVGLAFFLLGTLPEIAARHGFLLTFGCLAVSALFGVEYLLRLRNAPDRRRWAGSTPAVIDLVAAIAVPLALLLDIGADNARLFGVVWSLKLVRLNAALELLGRVIRNERQPLVNVSLAFVVVTLFASTIVFVAERAYQPDAFGSVPDAIWWAATTITTTGYGDRIPVTLPGRILAGAVMVSGIGLFALWAGILASGFAREIARREFLQSWDLVVRLPLFRNLGAPALSDIARLLKAERCGADTVIVRQGEPGDSMYFIAEGEVEVRAPSVSVRLGPGQFFGEMALITGEPRSATVTALSPARLLRLDMADFRALAGKQPTLLDLIETESRRRQNQQHAPRDI
jgi:voltage-gated potassium channel